MLAAAFRVVIGAARIHPAAAAALRGKSTVKIAVTNGRRLHRSGDEQTRGVSGAPVERCVLGAFEFAIGCHSAGATACQRQAKTDQFSAVASSDQRNARSGEDLVWSLPSQGPSGSVIEFCYVCWLLDGS